MGDVEAKRDLPPGASPISGLPPPVATRWKPGQSGNPGGRPKGESITALLRRVLEQEHHGRPLKEMQSVCPAIVANPAGRLGSVHDDHSAFVVP